MMCEGVVYRICETRHLKDAQDRDWHVEGRQSSHDMGSKIIQRFR